MPNEILRSFADNQALMDAVRGLLLKQFSVDNLEATQADIELGQLVRARLVGIKAVEDAWRTLEQYKTPPETLTKINPAK